MKLSAPVNIQSYFALGMESNRTASILKSIKLPNSNIYLKLHSILTLLFKSLRLLEFIFAVILYIERVTFLSSHSIQHYFRSKYSLQVSFNFQKLLSPKSFTLTIFQIEILFSI
ncbi:unnamed protein product [Rotaria socialis]